MVWGKLQRVENSLERNLVANQTRRQIKSKNCWELIR